VLCVALRNEAPPVARSRPWRSTRAAATRCPLAVGQHCLFSPPQPLFVLSLDRPAVAEPAAVARRHFAGRLTPRRFLQLGMGLGPASRCFGPPEAALLGGRGACASVKM
jgi:hypothetical protein